MAVALATLLGEIGLPGRGFSFGLGTMAHMGNPRVAVPLPTFPQGLNPVEAFIPVARVSDMLLGPRRAVPSTTAAGTRTRTSVSSTGRAATRSTTTRT